MDISALRERFSVKRSLPGLGRGLFAAEPFKKGDFVLEYTGKKILTTYADTLKTRYLFEVDDTWTIDGGVSENIARYINHSCTPNCECDVKDGRILIHATRDIKTGEELTMDYGDEYFDEFIRPKGCKCNRCSEVLVQNEPISA